MTSLSRSGVTKLHPWNPAQWTEEYLISLVGQPESSQLEYKSGKALAGKEDKTKFVHDQLSPVVSAFANSEGGIVVIGMAEDPKTRPRVAKELDGVNIDKGQAIESSEQFQQIVESCINPYLPGMRVKRIALSGLAAGRCAVVVYVPQGTTAYQANDHLYYSRSEFETKSMPDHEVRLRIFRGRSSHGHVEILDCKVLTADHEWTARQEQHQKLKDRKKEEPFLYGRGAPTREFFEAPKRGYDEYSFRLNIVNTGEVTIRDFLLSLTFSTDLKIGGQGTFDNRIEEVAAGKVFRFRFAEGVRKTTGPSAEYSPAEKKLFPDDRVWFPTRDWVIQVATGQQIKGKSIVLGWTIYLDDAPPNSGEINVMEHFQEDSTGERGVSQQA